MKAMDLLSDFLVRFRYPISLPEDISKALGVPLSNRLPFNEFVNRLAAPALKPTTLSKFMLREKAEEAFCNAPCQERFNESTLITYYFKDGPMQFILKFKDEKLRRVCLLHKDIPQDEGIEIQLS